MKIEEIDSRLEDLLIAVSKCLPEGEDEGSKEIRDAVLNRVKNLNENPLFEELSMVFNKPYSLKKARDFILYPSTEDIAMYPKIISATTISPPPPTTHPIYKIQQAIVSMLYLVHIKQWSLTKEFINQGGLLSIVSIIEKCSDDYIRSQAIDTFMQITSVEIYDWFNVDNLEKEPIAYYLNLRMLELYKTNFIPALLGNFYSKFPGESFFCLQILGFWLSWVRIHFVIDNKLPLTKEALQVLSNWAVRKDDVSKEECELAQKMLDDFSRLPPIESFDLLPNVLKIPTDMADLAPVSLSSLSLPAPTLLMPEEENLNLVQANKLKEDGNSAFTRGNYLLATQLYTKSIALNNLNPSTWNNRAASKIKQFLELSENCSEEKDTDFLNSAVNDCNEAIRLDETYGKAYLRRCQAERLLGKLDEALVTADLCEKYGISMSLFKSLLNTEILGLQVAKEGLHVVKDEEEREILKMLLTRSGVSLVSKEIEESNKISSLIPPLSLPSDKDIAMEVKENEKKHDNVEKKNNNYFAALNKLNRKAVPKPKAASKPVAFSGLNSTIIRKDESKVNAGGGLNGLVTNTLYEIQTASKRLNDDTESFAIYLKKIPTNILDALFKEAIDEDLLQRILTAIDLHYFPDGADNAFLTLKSLTKSKRFDVFLMGIDANQSKLISSILDKIVHSESLSQDFDAETLKEMYKLI